MSLQTDKIFIQALSWTPATGGGKSVTDVIWGRLFGTAIPLPEEQLDNEPLPYGIVLFNGLTNEGQSKDNPFEGDSDTVQIGITFAASTLDELQEITVLARQRIREYFAQNIDNEDVPLDYQFSASPISYDGNKPCYWQTLNYNCETLND